MKSFDRMIFVVFLCIVLVFIGCNIFIPMISSDSNDRQYRVEINRVAADIEKSGRNRLDLSDYPCISGVYLLEGMDRKTFFQADSDYAVREVKGKIYRIDYTSGLSAAEAKRHILRGMNFVIFIIAALVLGVLLFVRYKIIKPFHELSEIPFILAKGNLAAPLPENRERFFGKFVWGINVLRENMEQAKKQELKLQKEKKTLVLSISHDIKTPLSAIKLYAKALSKGLYADRQRQIEIAENINSKADEIEAFISEIIRASNEDFLSLPVKNGECLLSEVLQEIDGYYEEKLKLVRTEFSMGTYTDCFVRGDKNRVVEVLQNVLENAIKYGNGDWIRISAAREEDCCLVSIENSGCTLAQAELAHIFDSFWRGSNAGNVGGSGLGLYICRKLMEKMDGTIFAEMENGEMRVTVVLRKI